MKTTYDPKADAMYIHLFAGTVFDTDEGGRVLGVEMLDASKIKDKLYGTTLEMRTA